MVEASKFQNPSGSISRHSWADAVRKQDFGIIADWFANYFFAIGFAALVCVGIAAGLSGADGLGPETRARDIAAYTMPSSQAPVAASKQPVAASQPMEFGSMIRKDLGLGLRVFSLGLLLSGACACLGWVLGLLFGIPRATAVDPSGGTGAAMQGRQTNTNLMEISDWLTKTIVGVGLTQLMKLPKFLGDLTSQINRFGFQWGDYGQLAGLCIILYFVLGGFWLGYVGTRTLLTGLFDHFSLPSGKIASAGDPENLQIASDNSIRPANAALRSIDAALLAVPLQSLQNEEEVVAWAAAQARSGNISAARIALENVLAGDPDNLTAGKQLLKVYLAAKEYPKAVALARKLPNSPPKMLAMLYDAPPGGFREAIDIGKSLLELPKYQNDARVHVWLAAAFGQQYTHEKNTQSLKDDDHGLRIIAEQVATEVTRAVQLDNKTRPLLLSLWHPAPDSIENDLKDIPKDNSILRQVLQPPPPTATIG